MTRTSLVITAALALVVTLPTISAHAQSPRTFVSAAGNDSNPCSFAAPCRHFQAAVNATSAGGEVDALDPAGYGPITISQAITIEGQGWSYIAPPAGGNGITINAVSGNVAIHGVSLNGAGITGGTNGVVFNSGGSLTIAGCVVQNFSGSGLTGNGILMQPASGTIKFVISNNIVSNNGYVGIYYLPSSGSTATANGVIDHVTATSNSYGVDIDTSSATGGSTVTAVSDSTASNNAFGLYAVNGPGSLTFSVDKVNVVGNSTDGIVGKGTATVYLGRSVVTGNAVGALDSTSGNTFYTYQDNRIDGNITSDIPNPLNTLLILQ